jgi:hypothetical protein
VKIGKAERLNGEDWGSLSRKRYGNVENVDDGREWMKNTYLIILIFRVIPSGRGTREVTGTFSDENEKFAWETFSVMKLGIGTDGYHSEQLTIK